MSKLMNINCDFCGESFKRFTSHINRNKKRNCRNYCSRSCYSSGISNDGHPMHGRQGGFLGKKHTDASRVKMRLAKLDKKRPEHGKRMNGKNNPMYGKNFFHSDEVKTKISKALSGKNNPNWKGGVSFNNIQERTSREYRVLYKIVFKRDGWSCIKCGSSKNIEMDHIKKFSNCTYKEKIDPTNLRTLCRECHKIRTSLQRKGIEI